MGEGTTKDQLFGSPLGYVYVKSELVLHMGLGSNKAPEKKNT